MHKYRTMKPAKQIVKCTVLKCVMVYEYNEILLLTYIFHFPFLKKKWTLRNDETTVTFIGFASLQE